MTENNTGPEKSPGRFNFQAALTAPHFRT